MQYLPTFSVLYLVFLALSLVVIRKMLVNEGESYYIREGDELGGLQRFVAQSSL